MQQRGESVYMKHPLALFLSADARLKGLFGAMKDSQQAECPLNARNTERVSTKHLQLDPRRFLRRRAHRGMPPRSLPQRRPDALFESHPLFRIECRRSFLEMTRNRAGERDEVARRRRPEARARRGGRDQPEQDWQEDGHRLRF